jgi:peroxiredoxin
VITTEPVLEGTLQDPRLTDVAEAWGVGSAPWGVASMPWIFVIDRDGLVRAKYQGVMGTADVDVLLSLLAQEG